ncbi:MAG: hypothetical protein QXZ17_08655 [Nitrososphaerota archaeon]
MEYESKPDEAYLDRNLCVQVMARMARQLGYNAGIRENIDWPILYIDLPTGQVSWHVPKEDVVRKFPVYIKEWDGHDVECKRKRLVEFIKSEEGENDMNKEEFVKKWGHLFSMVKDLSSSQKEGSIVEDNVPVMMLRDAISVIEDDREVI